MSVDKLQDKTRIDTQPMFEPRGPDTGLIALVMVAGYYRIAADPAQLHRQLALGQQDAGAEDIVRAANLLGLKARIVATADAERLAKIPLPALIGVKAGGFAVLSAGSAPGVVRLIDCAQRVAAEVSLETVAECFEGAIILVTRRLGGAGFDPKTFGFNWFLPSIWRYRRALSQVLIASFFVQLFALVTPLFFQLVIDKVLVHKGLSTLIVLVLGLASLGLFETVLQ